MAEIQNSLTSGEQCCGNICCDNIVSNLMLCNRCLITAYCSKECQTIHWKMHKSYVFMLNSSKATDLVNS